MSQPAHIRHSDAADIPALGRLYRDAFPDEDLAPLVAALLDGTAGVLSLVAVRDGVVVGHVAFTLGSVAGSPVPLALLAPLAVASHCQRQGLGSALVRHGLADLATMGVVAVLVLGDPGYYARFGFAAEERVTPPYPLVAEWVAAWQSLRLATVDPACEGPLALPEPWLRPALWAP